MYQIFNLSKRRLLSHIRSKTTSVLVPTHEQIAHLILEQKTANQALQTFEWAAKIPNFTHTLSTYRALIHKLCTFRQFNIVDHLLDEMPKRIGLVPDEDIFITIVRGYGRANMTREVIKVLDMVTKFGKTPSLKLLNAILDVLVKVDIDIAREFYRRKMMGNGDDYTYGILMKGFCLTNRIADGFKLLQVMKRHGVKVNVVVYNTLIYALCKNGKVGRARSLTNEMEEFSDVTYNILISAYCNEKNLVQAMVMIEKCFSNGFVPDIISLTKVIEILCNEGRISEAVEVLERVEKKGVILDVVAYNTLLKGFAKGGKVKSGYGFLKQMEMKGCLPNTETYNILIGGFCDSRMFDSALDLFHEMKRAGVNWDLITFETLIHGLCSCGKTRDGIKIFEIMCEEKGRFLACIGPYNSILYGLYRDNCLDEAYEFLNSMKNLFPRVVDRSLRILRLCEEGGDVEDDDAEEEVKQILDKISEEEDFLSAPVYASLIRKSCEKGCLKRAVVVINEMIGRGYFPVAATFNGLIEGLCRQGKVGRAVRVVEDLKMRGCLLDCESYGLIINGYCNQGEFHEGLMVFMEMVESGLVPNNCIWNAVIKVTFGGKSRLDYKLLQLLI